MSVIVIFFYNSLPIALYTGLNSNRSKTMVTYRAICLMHYAIVSHFFSTTSIVLEINREIRRKHCTAAFLKLWVAS